jgi:hypothetical protein
VRPSEVGHPADEKFDVLQLGNHSAILSSSCLQRKS